MIHDIYIYIIYIYIYIYILVNANFHGDEHEVGSDTLIDNVNPLRSLHLVQRSAKGSSMRIKNNSSRRNYGELLRPTGNSEF